MTKDDEASLNNNELKKNKKIFWPQYVFLNETDFYKIGERTERKFRDYD